MLSNRIIPMLLTAILIFSECSAVVGRKDYDPVRAMRSKAEREALLDMLRKGDEWKMSNYVTFCENPLAPKSASDCAGANSYFNETSCLCHKQHSQSNCKVF